MQSIIRSETGVNLRHLKVKNKHSYQHSKISLIHKLILKIQQILGSHKLKGHSHF